MACCTGALTCLNIFPHISLTIQPIQILRPPFERRQKSIRLIIHIKLAVKDYDNNYYYNLY